MDNENLKAIEALTQSNEYVNRKAVDTISQSIFHDFEFTLQVAIFRAILSKFEDGEEFLRKIQKDWIERSTAFLKSEAKRFQDVILKANAKERQKLGDNIEDIFKNYSNTLTVSFERASDAVEETIKVLLDNSTQTKKENENDN